MRILNLQYIINLNRINELVCIEHSVWEKYHKMYDSQPWTMEQFRYNLPLKYQASKVVINNKEVYGFSIAYEYLPDWFHISRLAINPDVSGKGLGKKLLKNQLDYFVNKGAKKCSVDLKVENIIAHSLYQSLGFNKLEGNELLNYVNIRERNIDEYLGNTITHIAMINFLK